tara:strand:- start:84411 stop:84722 length:312 start_codon:yes stop_codon:yes gene_type:complete
MTLQEQALKSLDDIKAIDVIDLNVKGLTSVADNFIVCSGTSNRHVKSIANSVVVEAKKAGFHVYGVEGEFTAEWILVNLGDVIVHVMQPETRERYELEKLWAQ